MMNELKIFSIVNKYYVNPWFNLKKISFYVFALEWLMVYEILVHTQNCTQILKMILHEIPEHNKVFQPFFLTFVIKWKYNNNLSLQYIRRFKET